MNKNIGIVVTKTEYEHRSTEYRERLNNMDIALWVSKEPTNGRVDALQKTTSIVLSLEQKKDEHSRGPPTI